MSDLKAFNEGSRRVILFLYTSMDISCMIHTFVITNILREMIDLKDVCYNKIRVNFILTTEFLVDPVIGKTI